VYGFDSAIGHSSAGIDTARLYDSRGDDEYRADVGLAQMSGAGFSNTAIGFSRNIARASWGVDRAWVNDLALANSIGGNAWDDYSATTDAKKDTRGFDDVVLSSLAAEEASVNVSATDELFGLLSELR
jgi:hypothetical protein